MERNVLFARPRVRYNEENARGDRRMAEREKITAEIRQWVRQNSEEDYAAFQRKLLPTIPAEKIHGVRTPALRKYAKELSRRKDAGAFLEILPHESFEEDQLHAFILSEMKDPSECMEELERFLPYIDNWATCDQLSPKCFRKYPESLPEKIREWMAAEETYVIRFGIGMLMQHFLDDRFDPVYLQQVSEVQSQEYYVNMMIAWYFATALAKQTEAALPYLEQYQLDPWVHNKTIQKAVESYRISDPLKEYIRTLRVKNGKTSSDTDKCSYLS